MNILIVHEVSYLRKVIYEIHEFPELFAKSGHSVTFLDFDEGATVKSAWGQRIRKVPGRIHTETQIELATPHAFGLGFLDRIWAIFSAVPLMIKLFQTRDFDVVLNFAVPTYGLQLLMIARLFKVPVVHRALDVSGGIRQTVFAPLVSLFERLVLRGATSISANNPAMANYVRERVNLSSEKSVQVDLPPLDLNVSQPFEFDAALAERLGIDGADKVLVYMGSFFHFSGLDEVIEELGPSLKADRTLKLLLIGGGAQEPILKRMVSSLNLQESVIFAGFVAFKDLSRYMCLGNVGLNPLKPDLTASVALPQKVMQYLASGLNVCSTELKGLRSVLGDEAGVEWCDSPKDVARAAIRTAQEAPPSRDELGHRLDKLAQMFDPSVAAESLLAHLKSVIRN